MLGVVLTGSGSRGAFARELALGGVLGHTLTKSLPLLDASPLRALLARALSLDGIADS